MLVVLKPDCGQFTLRGVPDTHEEQFILYFRCHALAHCLDVLRSIEVYQFNCGSERTQRQALIELALEDLDLSELDDSIAVHVSHLVIVVHAEIGTCAEVANL